MYLRFQSVQEILGSVIETCGCNRVDQIDQNSITLNYTNSTATLGCETN
jgi:hypothetical protein